MHYDSYTGGGTNPSKGLIGHRYPQCEAKNATFPEAANSKLENFPYKPNLGSTEKGTPTPVYKENLSSVASSALTTIHHLSSILGANMAAYLSRHSVPHLIHNVPPVYPMHHSTHLPANSLNREKSPMTPYSQIMSQTKVNPHQLSHTTFVIGPKAKYISASNLTMQIDSSNEQHCSFAPTQHHPPSLLNSSYPLPPPPLLTCKKPESIGYHPPLILLSLPPGL
ncbi:hypothetical protein M9H77_30490 [Catharanthus roseus]|uniref:Uncharacterized protein n=1 Tax=Catharanthus roseus TaxID=4058 RepID=A0ACC0A1N6_CATRO|nr:hypothetical protein M9H77_30490 [Catharanthus roseus]